MKKFLVFLIMLMAASMLTCALAEEDQPKYTSGDYEYILLEDGTAEITRYNGRDKKLTVPAELDGHQVSAIGDSAFLNCGCLTSITLPDSLSAIGDKVFNKCKSLKTVTVPRNSYAAQYCKENGLPYTYPDSNDWLLN